MGIGAGFERAIGEQRTLTVNLTLVEVGDAPVKTPDLPLVGQVSGRYETRHSALLNVDFSWR